MQLTSNGLKSGQLFILGIIQVHGLALFITWTIFLLICFGSM